MALSSKVISFNITTAAAGNTVTVTPGFETKAMILFWSGLSSSTDTNGAGNHNRGVGFATATQQRAVSSYSEDGIGTAATECANRTDACILECAAPPGGTAGYADVQSISSTQVVFEIQDAFSIDLRVTGLFLGGSEVTDAEIVSFTAAGTAPVDQEVVLSGSFDPTLVFFIASFTAAPPGSDDDSRVSFGLAKSSSKCFVLSGGSDTGRTNAVTESYVREGDVIVGFAGNFTSVVDRATFSSMTVVTGKGCTINWAARTNALRCNALFLGGTFQSEVGSFLTQTDTTTDMTGSTSFTPKALLFASHTKAQNSAGGLSAHDKWSMGVATSTSEQHCQAVADRDGNTNMFVSEALEQDHIYVNMDEVNRTLQGSANLTAVSSSGFTARMTDADPAQGSVCWLALGDAAASGTTLTPAQAAVVLAGQSIRLGFTIMMPDES